MKNRWSLRFVALCALGVFIAPLLSAQAQAPASPASNGDLLDSHSALQTRWEETLFDAYGGRLTATDWAATRAETAAFLARLSSPAARALWRDIDPAAGNVAADPLAVARRIGEWQGRFQHTCALEMLEAQRAGDIERARAWRALITLPKHANAVEGALILQKLAEHGRAQEGSVSQLLTREFLSWQTTRVREKLDYLDRLLNGRDAGAMSVVMAGRLAEAGALADFPAPLKTLVIPGATGADTAIPAAPEALFLATTGSGGSDAGALFERWRLAVENGLPNLLSAEEVARNERLLLKLVRLVPKEYGAAGVRDGQIAVPLEYRHAKQFVQQAENFVGELLPSWRTTKAAALREHGARLKEEFDALEAALDRKADAKEVAARASAVEQRLESGLGLTLSRSGPKESVIAESALEVTNALRLSQTAARAGKWEEAEAQRLEAYITLDLDIEKRLMPRDPELALRLERAFLDGASGQPGIKAALDARLKGPALAESYERASRLLDEGVTMLKTSLSPSAVIFTTVTILLREGLEAVIVLAALLAGMRGVENAPTRRRVAGGAWLALVVTGLTFWLSKTLISALAGFGEKLEAVISILAVGVLLMVTNWVFHKYYWVGWNAKIRSLSKAALGAGDNAASSTRWETFALIGVGFLTIYREGFETVLFLQTFILEGGLQSVLIGLAIGGGIVALLGAMIFAVGAKLPYRKLLVVTGLLVVSILMTVTGQTVRLFQTVGWLPVHPAPGVDLPPWVGTWFGLYSSWEGLLIPFAGLGYVAGAWLWVKVGALRKQRSAAAAAAAPVAVTGKAREESVRELAASR